MADTQPGERNQYRRALGGFRRLYAQARTPASWSVT